MFCGRRAEFAESCFLRATRVRRARFYTITAAGRKQLLAERKGLERVVEAIQLVLQNA